VVLSECGAGSKQILSESVNEASRTDSFYRRAVRAGAVPGGDVWGSTSRYAPGEHSYGRYDYPVGPDPSSAWLDSVMREDSIKVERAKK
jgi:hypothetical protein